MSTSTLGTASLADLQREIDRREKTGAKLIERREALTQQISEIDAELAQLGMTNGHAPVSSGSTTSGGARRGRKPRSATTTTTSSTSRPRGPRVSNQSGVTLADALAQSMEVGAEGSPHEMAEMVIANGYQTKSKNFNIQVANALRLDERFKRISRGLYKRVK